MWESKMLIPPFSVPIHKLPISSSSRESTTLLARLLLLFGSFWKCRKISVEGIEKVQSPTPQSGP